MALNKIVLMGRLGKDPELRSTPGGVSTTSFSICVDRDFKTEGQPQEDWIDLVAWRGTAEFICKHFTKGRQIVAEGRLQIRDWKSKDGDTRRKAEVVVERAYFGDSKKEPGNYNSPQFVEVDDGELDEDLPF